MELPPDIGPSRSRDHISARRSSPNALPLVILTQAMREPEQEKPGPDPKRFRFLQLPTEMRIHILSHATCYQGRNASYHTIFDNLHPQYRLHWTDTYEVGPELLTSKAFRDELAASQTMHRDRPHAPVLVCNYALIESAMNLFFAFRQAITDAKRFTLYFKKRQADGNDAVEEARKLKRWVIDAPVDSIMRALAAIQVGVNQYHVRGDNEATFRTFLEVALPYLCQPGAKLEVHVFAQNETHVHKILEQKWGLRGAQSDSDREAVVVLDKTVLVPRTLGWMGGALEAGGLRWRFVTKRELQLLETDGWVDGVRQ
ncbi:hypothetical protein CC80DRAFT_547535 [Byssothecium circinans]|uniref:Uncharacterized protein n=1 Tax=Byssothecium circinans TaxID=147558 RepID=A0A6A5TYC8_9PLEO|nr:hypothetical protein CC80DRAFT_547535 [Byssothecium circinans]